MTVTPIGWLWEDDKAQEARARARQEIRNEECAIHGGSIRYCTHWPDVVERHRREVEVERREAEVKARELELDEIVADGETLDGLRELRDRYGSLAEAEEQLDADRREVDARIRALLAAEDRHGRRFRDMRRGDR